MYLIENGEVWSPKPLGVTSLLVINEQIMQIGTLDRGILERALPQLITVDARDHYVIPGLIDPHQHLIGAGGEEGYESRTYCVPITEILQAGITTVIGCMGTDTTSRSLITMLTRVRQLSEIGVSAFMLTGGFQMPTPTITRIVLDDLVIITEIIGVGEISIADARAVEPKLHDLTKVVIDAKVGGHAAGKKGYSHFHVGSRPNRLKTLFDIVKDYPDLAENLYPTHSSRSSELMEQAVRFSKLGGFVDIDTTEETTVEWIDKYLKLGGDPERLTVSSDAHTAEGDCKKYAGQFKAVVRAIGIERALPFFTSNVRAATGLKRKGRIEAYTDADLTLIDKSTLEITDVFSRGRHVMKNGKITIEIKDKTVS